MTTGSGTDCGRSDGPGFRVAKGTRPRQPRLYRRRVNSEPHWNSKGFIPKNLYRQTFRAEKMAPLERLELPTNRFEAGYSIQLSYRGEVLPAIGHAGVLRSLTLPTDQLAD